MPEATNEIAQEMKDFLLGLRRVPVDTDLEKKYLDEIAKHLLKLDFQSEEPITLLISSNGGSYDATLQFCDLINMLNSPVDAVVYGDCCSMAVDLVQTCRHRLVLPGARMLVHYIRTRREWIGDDPELLEGDIAIFRENMARMREQRFALYEKRTRLSREKLATMFRHGETHKAFFSAEQAVNLKLADKIVYDFKLFQGRQYEKK